MAPWKGGTWRHTPAAGGGYGGLAINCARDSYSTGESLAQFLRRLALVRTVTSPPSVDDLSARTAVEEDRGSPTMARVSRRRASRTGKSGSRAEAALSELCSLIGYIVPADARAEICQPTRGRRGISRRRDRSGRQ